MKTAEAPAQSGMKHIMADRSIQTCLLYTSYLLGLKLESPIPYYFRRPSRFPLLFGVS